MDIMSDDERGFVFKVTVIGNGAVGKTSLIKKFTKGEFNGEYIMTLGAQFTNYTEIIDDTPCQIVFWDIAGQESFSHLRPNFYRGSRAGIIVFSHEENDHGDKSYRDLSKWLADFKKHCGKIPIIIFGNKIDLMDNEKVLMNEDHPKSDNNINNLMKEYNFLGYYKTSALTGEGVAIAFQELTKKLFDIYKGFM